LGFLNTIDTGPVGRPLLLIGWFCGVPLQLTGGGEVALPVDEPPADAALEEAAAAVAGVDAVVLAAAGVPAHLAQQGGAQGLARSRTLGWRSTQAHRTLA